VANPKFDFFVSTGPVSLVHQAVSCPTEADFSSYSQVCFPTQRSQSTVTPVPEVRHPSTLMSLIANGSNNVSCNASNDSGTPSIYNSWLLKPRCFSGEYLLIFRTLKLFPLLEKSSEFNAPPQPPRPHRTLSCSLVTARGPRSAWRRWLAYASLLVASHSSFSVSLATPYALRYVAHHY
jgi:hypothetical protein